MYMRTLLPGLIVVGVLGIIISFVLKNSDLIMSGAYGSGDRVRGNYLYSKDFNERSGMSTKLFLFGMPCVLAAIVVLYLK